MKQYKNRVIWTKIGWFIPLLISAILFGVSLSFFLNPDCPIGWMIVFWVTLITTLFFLIMFIVVLAVVTFKEFKHGSLNLWVYAGFTKGVLGVDDRVLDKDSNIWLPRYVMNANVGNYSIDVKSDGRNITLKVNGQLVE